MLSSHAGCACETLLQKTTETGGRDADSLAPCQPPGLTFLVVGSQESIFVLVGWPGNTKYESIPTCIFLVFVSG